MLTAWLVEREHCWLVWPLVGLPFHSASFWERRGREMRRGEGEAAWSPTAHSTRSSSSYCPPSTSAYSQHPARPAPIPSRAVLALLSSPSFELVDNRLLASRTIRPLEGQYEQLLLGTPVAGRPDQIARRRPRLSSPFFPGPKGLAQVCFRPLDDKDVLNRAERTASRAQAMFEPMFWGASRVHSSELPFRRPYSPRCVAFKLLPSHLYSFRSVLHLRTSRSQSRCCFRLASSLFFVVSATSISPLLAPSS